MQHLTGRIGELYAAMITRGQMALSVNQRGYDVVSAENEQISVKTVTNSTYVSLRKSTIGEVHRVIVLRVNVVEGEASIEEVFDGLIGSFVLECRDMGLDYQFPLSKKQPPSRPLSELRTVASVVVGARTVTQYENGTIVVATEGNEEVAAKPVLREIAADIGVSLLNSNGNPRNTRQLGAEIIETARAQAGEAPSDPYAPAT